LLAVKYGWSNAALPSVPSENTFLVNIELPIHSFHGPI
jgi:hypothetical protein